MAYTCTQLDSVLCQLTFRVGAARNPVGLDCVLANNTKCSEGPVGLDYVLANNAKCSEGPSGPRLLGPVRDPVGLGYANNK